MRRFLIAAREQFRYQHDPLPDKGWVLGPSAGPLAVAMRPLIANASDTQLEQLAVTIQSRDAFRDEHVFQELRAAHDRMYRRTVMACFSASPDSPVMFAHYASGHTGLCLTYEVDPKDFFPVAYRDEIPTVGIFGHDPKEIVRARLCTKHSDWAYEREHRLVLYERDPPLEARTSFPSAGYPRLQDN